MYLNSERIRNKVKVNKINIKYYITPSEKGSLYGDLKIDYEMIFENRRVPERCAIIYPEGYWNLCDEGQRTKKCGADGRKSDNWIMQDFNLGIFRLAKETGCEIVPTVLHYDETKKRNAMHIEEMHLW